MTRSIRIDPDFTAADLSRAERTKAWFNGRADGLLGVHCPVPGHSRVPRDSVRRSAEDDYRETLDLADQQIGDGWTPYIEGIHDTAHAASAQMSNWLLDSNRRLIVEVYRRAGTVVDEHARPEGVSAGAAGRFVVVLTRWRGLVHEARAAATAAGRHADLIVDTYWTALVRSHARRYPDKEACRRLRPPAYALDPLWAKPDPFLLLRYASDGTDDEATARSGKVLDKALDILGELADREHRAVPRQEKR